MDKLAKSGSDTSEAANKFEVNVGDLFISNSRQDKIIVRVTGSFIYDEKYPHYYYDFIRDALEGKWYKAVSYIGTKDEQPSSLSQSELEQSYIRITQQELDLWIKQAQEFLDTGELKGYELDESMSNESALVSVNSSEYLVGLEGSLQKKKGQLEGMQNIIAMKMAEQERKLAKFKRELSDKIAVFEKQIENVQRIITIIELYLGINEELHQLRDGEPADVNTKISFRQQVLYMDEEVKVLSNGGLDFQDVDKFDEWLVKDDNFKKMIPEEKCVVCFKPRRRDKNYTDDKFQNLMENKANHVHTYFLIRNGERVYRIYTDKIIVWHRLFPQQDELQKMFDKMQEEQ